MYTILHNSRCGKSREAMKILEESNKEFTVREYLKDPLNKEEIVSILGKLNVQPIDIIRTNEEEWKTNYKGKELSNDELIDAMIAYPKLIQRPIIFDEKSGVIGRPTELVKEFIQ